MKDMVYLVVGNAGQAAAFDQALQRALGATDAVRRVAPANADHALRTGNWDASVLCDAGEATLPLLATALAGGMPVLIGDPVSLPARKTAALHRTAATKGAGVTVGFLGPVTPGVAALRLELAHCSRPDAPLSVIVEQQLPSDSDGSAFRNAILESVITLAHLCGSWPLRVSAVADSFQERRPSALIANFLGSDGLTGGVNVCLGHGWPSRRIRLVTASATMVLEERAANAVLSVQTEEQPRAIAAGAEDLHSGGLDRRLTVPLPEPKRAIVDRFLRRIRGGGSDDLATLIYGLTLTDRILESGRRAGRTLTVTYRGDVRESPRFQIMRGGRGEGAPAVVQSARPSLTIVR